MKKSFTFCMIALPLSTLYLYADGIEIGCSITPSEEESCQEENSIFPQTHIFKLENLNIIPQKPPAKVNITAKKKERFIRITPEIDSINVKHQEKSFTILRKATAHNQICPPSCIEPLNIKNIKTVGVLETLNFIEKLNRNKRMILVDARKTSTYKHFTIPTATNIPNSILETDSKHITIILKLLGANKIDKQWCFKKVHTLLIFDNGLFDNQARRIILRLIELGYPQDKILYYYGGIKSWIDSGLTTI